MTTTPPVTFNFATWTALFPEFAQLNAVLGNAYFIRATGSIIWNNSLNPAYGDGNLTYLVYLATSHVAWLSCPKDPNGNPAANGTPASPLVGRISSAAEGSVNVQTEWNSGDKKALEAYLIQTKYGAEFWAATSQYRTAQYAARPTVVTAGRFRNFFSPGGGWGSWWGS